MIQLKMHEAKSVVREGRGGWAEINQRTRMLICIICGHSSVVKGWGGGWGRLEGVGMEKRRHL